jgi:hypothetical protein
MIVRELEIFSTILKQVASDNTKNLTVATQIDYYAIVILHCIKNWLDTFIIVSRLLHK